ncbi:MAG: subclass B2 metallo-beta-lactamase [Bdellovibrionales bacterium]
MMRNFIWLFCAIITGCATQHRGVAQAHKQTVSEANTLKLVHFRGPIYVSEDHFYDRENSVVYIGDKYVTVIGATWTPETAKLLVEEIKKVTTKPIKDVIDTNWHHDRSGGNSYFKSIGSKIYATKMTAQLMESGWDKMLSAVRKDWPTFPQLPLVVPDSIQDGDFELQGGLIKAFYLGPSHTEDGIFVYFPNEKTLYGGCILKEKIGYLGSANIVEYPKTLQKLKSRHLDINTVISGHWSSIHGPELIDQYLALLAQHANKNSVQ